MSDRFHVPPLPTRILFGADSVDLIAGEVARLGGHNVLLLTTPRGRPLAESIAETLRSAAQVTVFDRAAMHVPLEVASAASDAALAGGADLVVAIGGGSPIGLAKILGRDLGLPSIAVPTTYAGSEMTAVWGLTTTNGKETGTDERVRPRTVVYDPRLTLALPLHTSIVSGINALAHSVEALTAPDANPLSAWAAYEGARRMIAVLPRIHRGPEDLAARSEALTAAWMCATALGTVTMGLHHKICHVLGGTAGLSHAESHAVVLPYVIAFNQASAPQVTDCLQDPLGTPEIGRALQALLDDLGAPRSLGELGLSREMIPTIARTVIQARPANPRTVTEADVEEILVRALSGETAESQPSHAADGGGAR